MGVELKIYLIPKKNDFRPTAEQLSRLISALIAEAYIPGPQSPALARMSFETTNWAPTASKTGAVRWLNREVCIPFSAEIESSEMTEMLRYDTRLVWPIENYSEAGLKHPIAKVESLDVEKLYLDLEMHLSQNYVYQCSGCIEPFDDTNCKCGTPLEYWIEDNTESGANVMLQPDSVDLFYSGRLHHVCPNCAREFEPQKQKTQVQDCFTGEHSSVRGGATYRFAIVLDCGKSVWELDDTPRISKHFISVCESALSTSLYQVADAL